MSYVLGVILSLSLINTIFLVNNLKTHAENKKQLDNLYNFTIHNIELTNYTIDKNKKYIEINENQDTNNETQNIKYENQDTIIENQDTIIENQDTNNETQNIKYENQDTNNENNQSNINQTRLTTSVSQGFSQWSFLNLGRTLKQKQHTSLSLSKIE